MLDIITKNLLGEFCREHKLTDLDEDAQFEHFATYSIMKSHYSQTFNTTDLVVGKGGDTGIDGIGVLSNHTLITDIDAFTDQDQKSDILDIEFIFIQAERASGFDAAKLGNYGAGVRDFFSPTPQMVRNNQVKDYALIQQAIYEKASKFKRALPTCRLYYVTTGAWQADTNLEARKSQVEEDLKSSDAFSDVQVIPIGRDELRKLYTQTRRGEIREFEFDHKTPITGIDGVDEAFLGLLPASTYMTLLEDENHRIIGDLFYDNVRGYQGENPVNKEIATTLKNSESAKRFALLNNGVTIIARKVINAKGKITIEDYQIVNGCQTSYVIFSLRDQFDQSIMIPVRLIGTANREVVKAITYATNRQTAIANDLLLALEEFPQELEQFFEAYSGDQRFYYERRSKQHGSLEDKTRIITQQTVISAFASMFLTDPVPHQTTRNFSLLMARIPKDIFAKGHRLEPYYVSSVAWYRLETCFNSRSLESKYKVARFHILLAMRLLFDPSPLPQMNSHEMKRYCDRMATVLHNPTQVGELIRKAVAVIDTAAREINEARKEEVINNWRAAGLGYDESEDAMYFDGYDPFDRDNIRSEPFTRKVIDVALRLNQAVAG